MEATPDVMARRQRLNESAYFSVLRAFVLRNQSHGPVRARAPPSHRA
jgi:hypothetical protein